MVLIIELSVNLQLAIVKINHVIIFMWDFYNNKTFNKINVFNNIVIEEDLFTDRIKRKVKIDKCVVDI